MPKHDHIIRAVAGLRKAETQPASSLSTGQARKTDPSVSRVRNAPMAFVIQVGSQFLMSASDGLVAFGPRTEAWAFASRRNAWAFMGRENVPMQLQKRARIVVEAPAIVAEEAAA